MDLVVYLALAVLATVFVVSLIILVIMCRRRSSRFSIKQNNRYLRFSKKHEDNVDGLMHLSPLMAKTLDKNSWVYDVTGLLQHCVALLRLCHSLSERLAGIPLQQAGPQLSEVFYEAAQRVIPRFDDLLSAVASPHIDVRVLEARATALATVCWALFLPFSLLNPKYKEMLGDPLREMDTHLEVLRQAADFAERSELGKLDADWTRMNEGEDDSPVEASATIEVQDIPLVDTSKMQTTPAEKEPPLCSNGNAHPIDPSV